MTPVWANHVTSPELNKAFCDFVSARIWGEPREFPGATTMAVMDGSGVMVAGLIYYDFDRQAGVIQISGAADSAKWLTRHVLKEMFEYPFDRLGCQAVVMRVDPEDKRLGRILPAFGFERQILKRLRGRNKDECLYTLFDDVWRSNGFHKKKE